MWILGLVTAAALSLLTETRAVESVSCKPAGHVAQLIDLPEASGLAASRVAVGRLWMHNDSGSPDLFAIDGGGRTQGRITLRGVKVDDWEAMAIGPCGSRTCLFVGDIGDNNARRKQITVYRIAEPSQLNTTVDAEAIHAIYPDGAHDAEALLVAPDGSLMIVTKGDTGHVAAYRFPKNPQPGVAVTLERIGEPLDPRPGREFRITDGAISPDGRWVVLRTERSLIYYAADAFVRGDFRESHRVDVSGVGEPQGEALAIGQDGTIYLGSEGGNEKRPGTLAMLTCKP